jgi:hypothetical protein
VTVRKTDTGEKLGIFFAAELSTFLGTRPTISVSLIGASITLMALSFVIESICMNFMIYLVSLARRVGPSEFAFLDPFTHFLDLGGSCGHLGAFST